jgi:hypothetical protein
MAPELQVIFAKIWQSFETGVNETDSAWRAPVIGTIGSTTAELRMVVLRQADKNARLLVFHTDKRSQKANQLNQSSQVAWLFFDPASAIQIRVTSIASMHNDDEVTRQLWNKVPHHARQIYADPQAPGTELNAKRAGLLNDQEAFGNFLSVHCQVTDLDWLHIRTDGHLRAQFRWDGQAWSGVWVAA